MRDIVPAIACGKADDKVLLDLNKEEDNYGQADVPLAIVPSTDEIVLLQISRQRAKLEKNLGSIADLNRLPSALFVVDVLKEHIAVKEANRLGIPVFGIVDTNSDPRNIDYVIPANDDAKDSLEVILTACCDAIAEGLEERKAEKADEKAAAEQAEEAPAAE